MDLVLVLAAFPLGDRPPCLTARELLQEASRLVSSGFPEAAATRVRVVMELILRSHLHALNAWPRSSRATAGASKLSLHDMVCILRRVGGITSVEQNRLSQCNKILALVVHGDRITETWVLRMIDGASALYSLIGHDWNGLDVIARLPGRTMGLGDDGDPRLSAADLLA